MQKSNTSQATSESTTVSLKPVEYEQYLDICNTLYEQVFGDHFDLDIYSMMAEEDHKHAKRLGSAYDAAETYHYAFMLEEQPIGWLLCVQKDWQTLEIRNVGILPDYQRQGVYSKALPTIMETGKAAGYQKLISYHHPSNVAPLIASLKRGFFVTGLEMSEQFGNLVEVTYFYSGARRRAFRFRCGHQRPGDEILRYLPL